MTLIEWCAGLARLIELLVEAERRFECYVTAREYRAPITPNDVKNARRAATFWRRRIRSHVALWRPAP